MNEHLNEKFVFKLGEKQYLLNLVHYDSKISFRVDDNNSSPKRIYKDNFSLNEFRKLDNFFYSFDTIKNIFLFLSEKFNENNFNLMDNNEQMILTFQPNKYLNEIKIPLSLSDAYFDIMFNSLYESYKKLKEEIADLKLENLKIKIQSGLTPQENTFILRVIKNISFQITSNQGKNKKYNNEFQILNSKSDVEKESSESEEDNSKNEENNNNDKNTEINNSDEMYFNKLFKEMKKENSNTIFKQFLDKLNQYNNTHMIVLFYEILAKNMKNDDNYISLNIDLIKYLSLNFKNKIPVKSNKKGFDNVILNALNNGFWVNRWIKFTFNNIKDYENCFLGTGKFISECSKNLFFFRNRFSTFLRKILHLIRSNSKKEEYEILIMIFIITTKSFIICQNKYDNVNSSKEFNRSKTKIEAAIKSLLNMNKVQSAGFNIQIEVKNLLILKKNLFEILEKNYNQSILNQNNNNMMTNNSIPNPNQKLQMMNILSVNPNTVINNNKNNPIISNSMLNNNSIIPNNNNIINNNNNLILNSNKNIIPNNIYNTNNTIISPGFNSYISPNNNNYNNSYINPNNNIYNLNNNIYNTNSNINNNNNSNNINNNINNNSTINNTNNNINNNNNNNHTNNNNNNNNNISKTVLSTSNNKNTQNEQLKQNKNEISTSSSLNQTNKKSVQNVEKELDDLIIEDLELYISFLDSGAKIEQYEWKIITDLYNKKGIEIPNIFMSYINACFNIVDNKTILSYANSYISEIIVYYSKIVNENEKKNTKKTIQSCLNKINTYINTNNFMSDIIANSIYCFVNYGYIKYNDIQVTYNKHKDMEKYFIILKKIYLIDGTLQTLKSFRKFDFVRRNQHIFEKIISNNSIF